MLPKGACCYLSNCALEKEGFPYTLRTVGYKVQVDIDVKILSWFLCQSEKLINLYSKSHLTAGPLCLWPYHVVISMLAVDTLNCWCDLHIGSSGWRIRASSEKVQANAYEAIHPPHLVQDSKLKSKITAQHEWLKFVPPLKSIREYRNDGSHQPPSDSSIRFMHKHWSISVNYG